MERMGDAEPRLFKGSQLAGVLWKVKGTVLDEQGDLEDLNILLETLIQVQVTSKELNSVCLELISGLVEQLGSPDESKEGDERQTEFSTSDYAFTLELAC